MVVRTLLSLACLTLLLAPAPAVDARGDEVERPYPGIAIKAETRSEPPQRLWWAGVHLVDRRIALRVAPGGPDPDGDGPWQTVLMPPTKGAEREGFELAVNGDFFDVKRGADGKTSYRPEQPAGVLGPAATDARTWAEAAKPRPALIVKKSGKVTIEQIARPGPDDVQVIAGNVMLVEDGKPVAHENKARHPRTVIGLDRTGTRLTILIVDGRKKGVADGMSYAELSQALIKAGCHTALNLDGGGSSVLVLRDGKAFVRKNRDKTEWERPVANVLGVDVKGAK
jgi:hypothetical protein